MSKRKRAQREELESPQPTPQTAQAVDTEAWNSPDFRQRVVIDLVFVTLPAIVMVILGERTIAAAWFSVGILVVIWQFWREIRDLWRALRPARSTGQNGDEEPR